MRLKLAVICLLFAPLIGEAKPKNPPDENREKAALIFKEAESAYKLQKFEEALNGFQEAYELISEPLLLFNIAQCYRQLGRLGEAKKAYQTFLRDAPKSSLRANAEERIKELDAEISRLAQKGTAQISAQQDPTQVFFDGEAKGNSPLTLGELEPGEHRITVKKEGFVDFEVVATIKPGEIYELKVPQLVAVVTQQELQKQTQHRVYFLGAAGLGGLGVLSMGAAGLFLGQAIREQNDLSGPFQQQQILAKQNKIDNKEGTAIIFGQVATGLFVGGAVSATIGLIKKSKSPAKKETTGEHP